MTTNQTIDEINRVLETAQKKDINIQIETNTSSSVNYLDVTITNDNGQLRTKVYHKPTAEPYYLPYTSDHPHRYHRNIPYSVLLRAARLCSDVDDFNQERHRLDVSLLLSDYPPKLISNEFLRFFQVNDADLVLRYSDQQAYHQLHHRLLYKTTNKSKQSARSIKELVEHPAVLQTKQWDRSMMCPKYTFESGPRTQFPNEFFSWWRKHYQYPESPVKNVKIHLIPTTNPSLEKFLIRKKPSRTMLTRMESTHK
jgi:hypothetical protein